MEKNVNPYLAIINKYNKFNPKLFKDLEYVKIHVAMGDFGKKTALIEKQTLNALNSAKAELESIGGKITINSSVRNNLAQAYARAETFSKKLLKSGSLTQSIGEVKNTTAKVGYSEHTCGLAVDISVDMNGVVVPDNIKALNPDADEKKLNFLTRRHIMEKHGFILRYPVSPRLSEITGVNKAEGWHWRYVGPEHSQMIAKLRERLGEEVFLEDYVEILSYNLTANTENELLDKYVEIFESQILKPNQITL